MIGRLKSVARARLPARVYGPIRALRVRRMIAGFEPRTVEHLYGAFRLKVRLEDPLAQGWYDSDWSEPPEITELRRGRLRAGALVIDVGAHQGVIALILARIVGDEGHVVAVEAEPHNAAVARRNAEANGATNLTVVQAAVGATNGVLSFNESLNGFVVPDGTHGAAEVESLTIDELALRHGTPDVVLIDVEGYEAHVLDGARDTIARAATDFFVELHDASMLAAAGSTADEVVARFLDGPFDVMIARADDTPSGVDVGTAWQDPRSLVHREGLRCFVVARPSAHVDSYDAVQGHPSPDDPPSEQEPKVPTMTGSPLRGQDDLEPNKRAEIDTARETLEAAAPHTFRKPFGSPWGMESFLKWATIAHALECLGVSADADVLDLGCGQGWTTVFLAESGYRPTGVDLTPACIEISVARAARWGVDATFETGDMDKLDLGHQFDVVLVYDALHHSQRQRTVVANVARHLRPGGWVLFGEPSWLHGISPSARRVTRELGWIERGIGVRRLRRDCAAAGLADFRRFFEPTRPYESRGHGFAWQMLRLAAADVAVAPQASVWLAARRA